MKRFPRNVVIYLIPTGAHRTKFIAPFLKELVSYGAELWILPTEMGKSLLPDFEKLKIDYNVKTDFSTDSSMIIPEEDIVVVAPCTFNTFNKIAMGIADNYALSVIHNSIGKGVKCIIAPAMDKSLWENFTIQENLAKLQRQPNIQVIYPEYIYDSEGNLKKTTMAPYSKIADAVLHCYTKIKYENYHIDGDISGIRSKYIQEFRSCGHQLMNEGYLNGNAGFLAMKISEGILVTASGSKVGQLSEEDLTLVTRYEDNKVYWSGDKAPTSELPLVIELMEKFKDTVVVVHGHCRSITYNWKKTKYLTSEYLSYGEWGQTEYLEPILRKYDGKAIMKLHGEVIIATSFSEARKKYEEMRSIDG